jgi:hypothetical protein
VADAVPYHVVAHLASRCLDCPCSARTRLSFLATVAGLPEVGHCQSYRQDKCALAIWGGWGQEGDGELRSWKPSLHRPAVGGGGRRGFTEEGGGGTALWSNRWVRMVEVLGLRVVWALCGGEGWSLWAEPVWVGVHSLDHALSITLGLVCLFPKGMDPPGLVWIAAQSRLSSPAG